MLCTHPRKRFGLVIGHDGRPLIMERCEDGRANVRGSGVWVPRHEVREPECLPVFKDLRKAAGAGQPGLFDNRGEG